MADDTQTVDETVATEAAAPKGKSKATPVEAPALTDADRIAALETKVQFLWDMVVFLENNPNWSVNDYIAGATRPSGTGE